MSTIHDSNHSDSVFESQITPHERTIVQQHQPTAEELQKARALLESATRALGMDQLNGTDTQAAARLLGVSERTLWYKLKRYGL